MKTNMHILLDSSGYAHAVREQALEALQQHLHQPDKEERVFGLSTFAGELHHHHLAQPLGELTWDAAEYKPAGPSKLYDAILETIQLLRERELTSQYAVELVILTKGYDTASVHTLEEVKEAVKNCTDIRLRFPGANVHAMEHAALNLKQFSELHVR
jgi:hypothetical protein